MFNQGAAMNWFLEKLSSMKKSGDSLKNIILYWLPEIVSSAVLVTLPPIVESLIIAQLGSTILFGAVGMGNNFLHMLIKLSEVVPVASIAIIGGYNGAKNYDKCGRALGDTFWTTVILGLSQFLLIFIGAETIYWWLNVPSTMITVGAPFLKLKSFSFLLIFITAGLLGFMRAVKNTRVPMLINMIGIASLVFFDYVLVLGKLGFPRLELIGAAWAAIIQYSVMLAIALAYILLNPDYKKYFSKAFFSFFDFGQAKRLFSLSWPIIIDKSAVAASYVWLSKMIASLGTNAIATYGVVKDLERFAFLPAMASGVIITFLVSNSLGAKDPQGATSNIKKVYLLTFCAIMPALLILCIKASFFVQFFDPKHAFSALAVTVLPVISLLLVFDFTQVVLAGALRGASDVRFVMWSRFFACVCFFMPVSYWFSTFSHVTDATKFILVYGSFYITTGIMGLFFLQRIRSHKWHN